MKAVILAAGKGERLQPITHTRPKPLVPILDKPLIVWTLEALRSVGVDEAVVVVSYMADAVARALEEYRAEIPSVRLVDQGEELGTGDALMKAAGLVEGDFLVVYGDLLVEETVLRKLVDAPGDAVLGAVRVPNPWDYGVLRVSPDMRLQGIVEKPPRGSEPSNLVNAGVYRFSDDVFSYLEGVGLSPRGEVELTDAVTAMAGERRVTVVELSSDEWFEVGKPWNVLEANRRKLDALRSQEVRGEVEDGARLKGPVVVEEGAVVRSGSYIVGPAYIGRGASVGPNSYIRSYTVLGRGSRVGASVEVKASVVMEKVHASHLSYIGDSVVCEHANLGAGTVTANLRFDDKPVRVTVKGRRVSSGMRKLGAFIGGHVKTGINVSIMPGVKIGAYSWIAPGAVVVRDVPPRSFYRMTGAEYVVESLEVEE